MRRNGFSASSRHAPPGGTMGDTAGGDGRRGDWRYEKRGDRYQAIVPCHTWWTMRDFNPRPSNCKSAALATELMARIGGIYIIYRHGDGNATGKYRLHHICATHLMWRSKQAIFCLSPFPFSSSLPVQANRRMRGEAIDGEVWRRGRRGEMGRADGPTRIGNR